jgi:hypothetical protein
MLVIRLWTPIAAPSERVFDLARGIDAHQDSAGGGTQERAVADVTRGLIALGEEVTWEARHFGIKQRLTVRITRFERPARFQDMMVSGAFKSPERGWWTALSSSRRSALLGESLIDCSWRGICGGSSLGETKF